MSYYTGYNMPTRKRPAIKRREIVIPIGPSIAYIPLTHGKYSLIDREDAPLVTGRSWYLNDSGYAVANRSRYVSSLRGCIRLHRLLLNATDGLEVDHKNRNSLDNRRCNLRLATPSQNSMNKGMSQHNTSGFKGVTFAKANGKWMSQIKVNRKNLYLGYYDSPEAAYEAYQAGSARIHGEFGNAEAKNG